MDREHHAALAQWLYVTDGATLGTGLDRIMEYLDDPDRHIDDMADKLTILIEVMEDELRRRVFLFMPPQNEMALSRAREVVKAKTIDALPLWPNMFCTGSGPLLCAGMRYIQRAFFTACERSPSWFARNGD